MVFRTGDTSPEYAIGESIQNNLGSAFSSDPETYIGVICWAFGRAINEVFEGAERMNNQSRPLTMTSRLDIIEKFIGFTNSKGTTDQERREKLDRLYSRFVNPPSVGNITDYLKSILDDVFIGVYKISPDTEINGVGNTVGRIPGGLVNDVVDILDGSWSSPLSFIPVRVWNPRNHYNQESYSFVDFFKKCFSWKEEFDSYLPAGVDFDFYCHVEDGYGTVSGAPGSIEITGVGTYFITDVSPMLPGDELEIIADNDVRLNLIVDEAVSNTLLRVVVPPGYVFTNAKYMRCGIFLDTDGIIDLAAFNE